MTQSIALSALLRRNGHTVSEVLVGRCKNREIPQFFMNKIDAPVTLFDSPTIDYGSGGKHASVVKTLFGNATPSKMKRWRRSIKLIRSRINESDADVIVNFYELLLGASSILNNYRQPIVSIGHQFMIDHPEFRHRLNSESGSMLLRLNNRICSKGSHKRLALSFYPMEESHEHKIEVVPPLLRSEIFEMESVTEDFTLGYMLNPAYLTEVEAWKAENPTATVHLFWDKQGAPKVEQRMDGLWLHKINDVEFLRHMARCKGYVTTAGFESICEALYLGKPTLMIPAHVEQQINAADAHSVGAGDIAKEFNLTKLNHAIENYSADTEAFKKWVNSAEERFLKALTEL